MELESLLKQYFGYTSFRPGQHEVIQTLLEGRDCLAIMPTGAGKSICFQLPALMMPGVTLVISPLISLMKDQVDSLVNQEIPATYINSQCTFEEAKARFAAIRAGQVKLVYISPERLENEFFTSFMQSLPISMFIIDEAHCVSQWGHDFRPSYCAIKDWIAALPRRPVVGAFTATATEKVKEDMMTLLGLEKERIFIGGFDRPNLYFRVVRTNRKLDFALAYVQQHQEDSGIIYAATRKEVDRVYEELTRRGIRAGRYHAGLSDDVRRTMQDAFTYDRLQVIVATNAFGMGIDKSNVRFVIHHNMPESIEAYYQEAGRAGRDGEPSRCTLLWNEGDIVTRRRLLDTDNENERLNPEEREVVRMSRRRLLDGMIGYCRTTDCLHRYMTRYFGEPDDRRDTHCGNCSNCQSTFETIDVTDIARAISRCVHDVNQGFGSGKIVAVLRGSRAQDVVSRGLDRCPSYGMLRDVPEARVRDVLSQMATDGFLSISEGRLPIVCFGPRAAETAADGFHYEIKRVERRHGAALGPQVTARRGGVAYGVGGSAAVVAQDAAECTEDDEALFARLRALRRDIAQEIGKPPYIVFSDKTLRDMCAKRPASPEEFLEVNGVGENKLNLYGERFLAAIAEFA